MIDIHCHLLPGLDDGAKSVDEALGLARQSHEVGFHTVIATPHVFESRNYLTPEKIIEGVDRLNYILEENQIGLRIYPGAENYIFPDMAKWAVEGKLLTLANTRRYLLIELPRLDIPHYTDKVFFELQVAGITPVLAHPERYKKLLEDPYRLLEWARRGILLQMNLRSLTGHYGQEIQEFAHWIVANRLISLLGSDAHRLGQNMDDYNDALRIIKEHTDDQYLETIARNTPRKILEGITVEVNLKEDYTLFRHKRYPTSSNRRPHFIAQKLRSLLGK